MHINKVLKHDYKNVYRTGTTLVKAFGDKYEFYELILKCRLRWTRLDIVTFS